MDHGGRVGRVHRERLPRHGVGPLGREPEEPGRPLHLEAGERARCPGLPGHGGLQVLPHRRSTMAAAARSRRWRSRGGVEAHAWKARAAVSTARAASTPVEVGTGANTSPL